MACAICKTRREKRHCPGVQGEICAVCCGEQREETIDCPLDCEYLQTAHEHEIRAKDPAGMPNADAPISQSFIAKNIYLVVTLQAAVLRGALQANAVDNDVKEALEALVRTYRTLESGIYYESRPTNPMAFSVYDAVQQQVNQLRERENQAGVHKLLDSQIQQVLMFFQNMEYAFNNGRKRGRAYLDNLRTSVEEMAEMGEMQPDSGSLIVS